MFQRPLILRLLASCSFAIVLSVPVQGQAKQASLKIGGHEVTLGMPAEKLILSLQGDYDVRPVKPEAGSDLHEWLISKSGSGQAVMPLATIYSKDNMVVGVRLGSESESSQEIFDALFGAISKLSGTGDDLCFVATGTDYLPEPVALNKAEVSLKCGPYLIILLRNEFKGASGTSVAGYIVSETIGITQ